MLSETWSLIDDFESVDIYIDLNGVLMNVNSRIKMFQSTYGNYV